MPSLTLSLFGHTAAIDGDWLAIGNWYGYMVHVYRRTPGRLGAAFTPAAL